MKLRLSITAWLGLLAFVQSAVAQDNFIFDVDDFIDPRERGYVFSTDEAPRHRGTDFLVVLGTAGYARNLKFGDSFLSKDSSFASGAMDWYRGKFQFGLQANYFGDDLFQQGNTFTELQLSYYDLVDRTNKAEQSLSRSSIFLARGTDADGSGFDDVRLVVDVALAETRYRKYPFGGGWEYRYRNHDAVSGEPASDEHSLRFRVRTTCQSRKRSRFLCGMSLGGIREDSELRLAPIEFEFSYQFLVRPKLNAYLRYFPSYDFDAVRGTTHWNHQVAVFFNYPLHTKLWRNRP